MECTIVPWRDVECRWSCDQNVGWCASPWPSREARPQRGVAAGRSAQRACERGNDWRRGARRAPPTRISERPSSTHLSALFEPKIGQEIVIDGEQRAVVQDELVVETRNGVLAPPFVVDAPAVLDRSDRAWGQAALGPDRDDAPRS